VRIVAGEHRGARIFAPKGHDTRPTSDRVREAAFNLIGPVDGASVLDLFAGSGAMGLEALSRGAASATFVENDREAVSAIKRNVEKLRVTGAKVVQRDVLQALATERTAYDLVLCDPPYGYPDHERLVPYLARSLAPEGLLVYETAAREEPQIQGLSIRTSRTYGSARLTLFQH
jgi:16S rRNA (guanine966-N2)-methyltransferase